MNLNTACKPRQSVFDRSRKDVVLNIDDLLKNKIDAHQFFSENFITSGMHTLFDKVFSRLNCHSNHKYVFT
jgi:predicted AAA+ superfamily ATPase